MTDHASAPIRAAVLTVSDSAARGERSVDVGGQVVREVLESFGAAVVQSAIVPDERAAIEARLRAWADSAGVDVIATTGGTGLSPRDVTPEATLAIAERLVPGMAEVMRARSLAVTPQAMLSRAVAAIRGRTLILNLPGSPRGARECLEAIAPALRHAVETLRDEAGQHTPPAAGGTAR